MPISNCPRDGNVLRKKALGDSEGDACPTCGGIWLKFNTVKSLYESTYIHAPSKFYHDSKPNLDYRSWDSEISCPVDGNRFRTYFFRNVEIDICSSCKGLWLDNGELEKLHVSKIGEIAIDILWFLHYL